MSRNSTRYLVLADTLRALVAMSLALCVMIFNANAWADSGPGRILKGKRFKVRGVDASFVVPNGWNANYVEQGGEAGIALTNRRHPNAAIFLTSKMLTPQQVSATIPQLLQMAARESLGQTPVRIVSGPRVFLVDGKDAGMTTLEGESGGVQVRARFAGIRIERWGAVFLAIYDARLDSVIAPVFDTVLMTFRGKAPKQNAALAARIAGCWEKYDRDSGITGSNASSVVYRFDRNGNYSYRYFMSVSIPGGAGGSNTSKAAGRFTVVGNQLILQSNKGKSSNMRVRERGGQLFLGNSSYIPCG